MQTGPLAGREMSLLTILLAQLHRFTEQRGGPLAGPNFYVKSREELRF